MNTFLRTIQNLLKDEKVANGALLRGFSEKPDITPFSTKYRLKALAIATYPMYRGISKVLGMDVRHEPKDNKESLQILKDNFNDYQFFFLPHKRNRPGR